jgi:hypothetical protein
MSRIDSTQQLTELLRRRLGALKEGRGAAQAAKPGRAATGAASSSASGSKAHSQADMASVLAKRVQLIASDDPQRQSKAFRAFLETMLLVELGESLINDPAFYDMVDHVQQQMEGDPQLAEAMSQASKILLGGNDA